VTGDPWLLLVRPLLLLKKTKRSSWLLCRRGDLGVGVIEKEGGKKEER